MLSVAVPSVGIASVDTLKLKGISMPEAVAFPEGKKVVGSSQRLFPVAGDLTTSFAWRAEVISPSRSFIGAER